jgi:chromosome segregation ATPase
MSGVLAPLRRTRLWQRASYVREAVRQYAALKARHGELTDRAAELALRAESYGGYLRDAESQLANVRVRLADAERQSEERYQEAERLRQAHWDCEAQLADARKLIDAQAAEIAALRPRVALAAARLGARASDAVEQHPDSPLETLFRRHGLSELALLVKSRRLIDEEDLRQGRGGGAAPDG